MQMFFEFQNLIRKFIQFHSFEDRHLKLIWKFTRFVTDVQEFTGQDYMFD